MPTIAWVKNLETGDEFQMSLQAATNIVNQQPEKFKVLNENFIPSQAVQPVVTQKKSDVTVKILTGENAGTTLIEPKPKRNAKRNTN